MASLSTSRSRCRLLNTGDQRFHHELIRGGRLKTHTLQRQTKELLVCGNLPNHRAMPRLFKHESHQASQVLVPPRIDHGLHPDIPAKGYQTHPRSDASVLLHDQLPGPFSPGLLGILPLLEGQPNAYSYLCGRCSGVEIKEGMVYAMETYAPAEDGRSAARIEEEVVVTANGSTVITLFPCEELMVANEY